MGCASSKAAVSPVAGAEPAAFSDVRLAAAVAGGAGAPSAAAGGAAARSLAAAGGLSIRSLAAAQLAASGHGTGGAAARTLSAAGGLSMRSLAAAQLAAGGQGAGGAAAPTKGGDGAHPLSKYQFQSFTARYSSLDDVTRALRKAGLESSNLIVAVDYTKSNSWQTRYGPGGLHTMRPDWGPNNENPYQRAIRTIGATLAAFDDDGLIPAFGFGDTTTTDKTVFPFFSDRPARGFAEVLKRYAELTPKVVMSGPTSFAPAIDAAVHIVKSTGQYHILLIIADGQVTSAKATADAIVRASAVALSILIVGVGDELDDDAMRAMDEGLPARKFDNLHVVRLTYDMTDVQFTTEALMEIPDQYLAVRELGLI